MLVHKGQAVRLPRDEKTGARYDTALVVYRRMLLTICREYRHLPASARDITIDEIATFYNDLHGELIERFHTWQRIKALSKTT